MTNGFIKQLEWRFATKTFDPSKKVSEEDIGHILNAIRMSPSSFGLQPFHVHIVTDKPTKEKLRQHSWDQAQVEDCSHFLIFSARTDINQRIDDFMKLLSKGDQEKREQLKAYENIMRGFSEDRSEEWLNNWAGKQAYIALGFAMAACAELQIDACPMEGFEHEAYNNILELPEHMNAAVALAIGYRSKERSPEKNRFPKNELFTQK